MIYSDFYFSIPYRGWSERSLGHLRSSQSESIVVRHCWCIVYRDVVNMLGDVCSAIEL